MTRFWILEIGRKCDPCNGTGEADTTTDGKCYWCGGAEWFWIAHCPGTPRFMYRYGSEELACSVARIFFRDDNETAWRVTEVHQGIEGYLNEDGEPIQFDYPEWLT